MGIVVALPIAFAGRSDVLALDIDGQPAAWPGLVLMLGLGLWQLARSAPTR